MKRTLGEFWLYRDSREECRRPLAEERHILEAISLGAPLPRILNELCAAIDLQIGNVVSLVMPPEAEQEDIDSVTLSATQVGLHVFSSTDILSCDKSLLGTFQMYCCDERRPTGEEDHLIERAIQLAALALERNKDKENLEWPGKHLRDEMGDSALETHYIN